VIDRAAHHREIELVRGDPAADAGGVAHLEVQRHRRVRVADPAEQARDHGHRRGRAGAHPEPPRPPRREARHALLQALDVAQEAIGLGAQLSAGVGQVQRLPDQLQQRGAQAALELAHLAGDRRLGAADLPGGSGEAAVVADRQEGLQLLEVHL